MANTGIIIASGTEDTHDLCVDGNEQIVMVDGIDAYAQIINCEMRTIYGERQLNVNSGIPYLETVFADRSTVSIWEAQVYKMLLALPFVISVISITTRVKDGVLLYETVVDTDLGPVYNRGAAVEKSIRDKRLVHTKEDKPIQSYIIKFVYGDDIVSPAIVSEPGKDIDLPIPIISGLTFVGWYSDSELTERVKSFTMPEEDVVLYAKFESFSEFEINVDSLILNLEPFTIRLWSTIEGGTVNVDWGDGTSVNVKCHASANDREGDDTAINRFTLASHTYGKQYSGKLIRVRINSGCSKFKIGARDASSHSGIADASQNSVRKAISWGESIINAFRTYSYCRNLTGQIPEWGNKIEICDATYENTGVTLVASWPEGARFIQYCFAGCHNLTGKIPVMPESVTRVRHAFDGCSLVEPTEREEGMTDEEYELLIMPTQVREANFYANYVRGCSDSVRENYFVSWGGTKSQS